MYVYTIGAHQRITKAALPDSLVFSACEVLEILDVLSPFITLWGPCGLKLAMHISSNDMQWEDFMRWCSPFSLFIHFNSGRNIRIKYAWNPSASEESKCPGNFCSSSQTTPCRHLLFSLFDENSRHSIGAECQRAGRDVFFSARAKSTFWVHTDHVTRCRDSFPARWH